MPASRQVSMKAMLRITYIQHNFAVDPLLPAKSSANQLANESKNSWLEHPPPIPFMPLSETAHDAILPWDPPAPRSHRTRACGRLILLS
jgi:hypothetical protein